MGEDPAHIYISRPRPIRRPKVPDLGHRLPRQPLRVRRVQVDVVPPPVREHRARVGDAEEDDEPREGEARVQRGGQDVVVLGPPG